MNQRTRFKSKKVFQLQSLLKKKYLFIFFHLMYCQSGEITNVVPEVAFFFFPL
jgi:hypothetical protein